MADMRQLDYSWRQARWLLEAEVAYREGHLYEHGNHVQEDVLGACNVADGVICHEVRLLAEEER